MDGPVPCQTAAIGRGLPRFPAIAFQKLPESVFRLFSDRRSDVLISPGFIAKAGFFVLYYQHDQQEYFLFEFSGNSSYNILVRNKIKKLLRRVLFRPDGLPLSNLTKRGRVAL
jgi:hypothetical protein